MHFQIVSRLFEVEGFHRLIDALELCGAGHFEVPGNVISDDNLNKFRPLTGRDNGAGFTPVAGDSLTSPGVQFKLVASDALPPEANFNGM